MQYLYHEDVNEVQPLDLLLFSLLIPQFYKKSSRSYIRPTWKNSYKKGKKGKIIIRAITLKAENEMPLILGKAKEEEDKSHK